MRIVYNPHIVGVLMRDVIQRAITVICREVTVFQVTEKDSYSGEAMADLFTSADTKAQEVVVKTLKECFPKFGIICEEKGLVINPEANIYFTLDPLDGTKAFVRRQSHGVGSMVAMVDHDEIVSACVGDVNTNELYYFRPESGKVHRIKMGQWAEDLSQIKLGSDLKKMYILSRCQESNMSQLTLSTIGKFKELSVDGGSIGIFMARLWKNEVGAVHLPPSFETPWDSTPVIGITQKLGYIFLRPNIGGNGWIEYLPALTRVVYEKDHETLIVHKSLVASFTA